MLDLFLTSFSTLFQLSRGCQRTYPCSPGILFTTKYSVQATRLLSHMTIVQTMDSGERGMNPVAMTIINPGKNISRANTMVTSYQRYYDGDQLPEILRWGPDTSDTSMGSRYQRYFDGVQIPAILRWGPATRDTSMGSRYQRYYDGDQLPEILRWGPDTSDTTMGTSYQRYFDGVQIPAILR